MEGDTMNYNHPPLSLTYIVHQALILIIQGSSYRFVNSYGYYPLYPDKVYYND